MSGTERLHWGLVRRNPTFFILGTLFAVVGVLLTIFFNPATNQVSYAYVVIFYPVGIALYIGGASILIAALLDLRVARLDSKIDYLTKTVDALNHRLYGNSEEEDDTTRSETRKENTPQ